MLRPNCKIKSSRQEAFDSPYSVVFTSLCWWDIRPIHGVSALQFWYDSPGSIIIRKVKGIRFVIQIEKITSKIGNLCTVGCQLSDLSKRSRRCRIPGFEFLQHAKHFRQSLFGVSKLPVAFLCVFASVKDTLIAFCFTARAWRRARALTWIR